MGKYKILTFFLLFFGWNLKAQQALSFSQGE